MSIDDLLFMASLIIKRWDFIRFFVISVIHCVVFFQFNIPYIMQHSLVLSLSQPTAFTVVNYSYTSVE